ncbi:MAG: 2-oxoacid:acceptor oxidoreductase subunit alpha [Microgenomates group bacterium]
MKQSPLTSIQLHRIVIKASGESGQGVNSVGEVLAKSIKESGLYTFGYREYPSLIKGGWSSHQIDFASTPINSSSAHCDILMCLSRASVREYLKSIRPGGILVHAIAKLTFTELEQNFITENAISLVHVPAAKIAIETGGMSVMANTVLVGVVWQIIGLDLAPVEEVITRAFVKKPKVIEPNLACLRAGHSLKIGIPQFQPITLTFDKSLESTMLLTGNHALSLGAVAAGVRVFYAYPMTPSSSILSYLASIYHQTGMVVKQIEDEITVAQMALGSMFAGTRALIATSGGGFDLMTESVSLSGMTETPLVCILAQRPGPATGLPTWTSATDLNVAVYAGHGEYSRLVIAGSDLGSCYKIIQKAFNFAEKYQIPVIVLTEKQIAESLYQLDQFPADEPIERHFVPENERQSLVSADRFKITDSGISKRWAPDMAEATYDANSDEHLEDGSLTEDAEPSEAMYTKRLRKTETLLAELPEPELYGPPQAQTTFVGWGSVKHSVLDTLALWNSQNPLHTCNYLHYEYVWPLKVQKLQGLIAKNQQLILIEQNATGQLGNLLTIETGYIWKEKLLKFDGRPFFIEDIMAFLQKRNVS